MTGNASPFEIHAECELENPSLLVGFSNEIGGLASGVFDFLSEQFALPRVATIHRQPFYAFHGVNVQKDIIQFPDAAFYRFAEGNLLLFYGNVPEREPYDFCHAILDHATRNCGVDEVFTLGGFVSPINHLSPRQVFGTVNRPELRMFLRPYEVSMDIDYRTPAQGPRPSLNHFFLWTAKQRDIPGYSLWSEVPFYLAPLQDPAGIKALLDAINKRFVLNLPLEYLDSRTERVNRGMTALQQQNPEVARCLRLLEQGIALSHEEGETLAREVAGYFEHAV